VSKPIVAMTLYRTVMRLSLIQSDAFAIVCPSNNEGVVVGGGGVVVVVLEDDDVSKVDEDDGSGRCGNDDNDEESFFGPSSFWSLFTVIVSYQHSRDPSQFIVHSFNFRIHGAFIVWKRKAAQLYCQHCAMLR
jgi:hypothetical protein